MFTYRLHAADIFSLNRFNFICESCSVHRSCSLPLSGWEKCSGMPREIRFIRDNRDVFWAISEHSGRVCPLAVARDTMCSCRHIFCALLSHLCYYLELLEVDRDRTSASVRQVTVVAMETLSDTYQNTGNIPWSQRLSFILYWQILRRESLLNFFLSALISASRRKFLNEKR